MNDPFLLAVAIAVPLGVLLIYLLIRYVRHPVAEPERFSESVPEAWWPIVVRQAPLLSRLDSIERDRLLRHTRTLIRNKHWEGCGGLVLTDEMKIAIASQACLLMLHVGGPAFPGVDSVLVYPGAFVPKRAGWVAEATPQEEQPLAGEAHAAGQVVLAWDAVAEGADPASDKNVVLHEFAHQLDMEDKAADGVPILEQSLTYRGWRRILQDSYDHLTERLQHHADAGALREYGATNPAEFFAVATESFFLKPMALAEEYPELFDVLRRYYRKDPREWFGAAPSRAPAVAALREAFAPTPWGRLLLRSLLRWQVISVLAVTVVFQIMLFRGGRSLRALWLADCRNRYAHARGPADSARVDRRLNGAGSQVVSCLSLRLTVPPKKP